MMVNARTVVARRDGLAAAEFALMLPMLLIMIFGTMQMSLMMYSYNTMVSVARDTARSMAVCTVTDSTTAYQNAQQSRPPWLTENDWHVTPTIPIGQGDVSMTITVDAAKAGVLNYLPIHFGDLTTTVVMRKEPLAFGAGSC